MTLHYFPASACTLWSAEAIRNLKPLSEIVQPPGENNGISFMLHLLVAKNPHCHQNLISCFTSSGQPLHKNSSRSVRNFPSYLVQRQTDRYL